MHRLLCLNFGFKFLARQLQRLFCTAHIASDFTCVYCSAAGTILRTTDVYELDFSYLSISIFTLFVNKILTCINALYYFYTTAFTEFDGRRCSPIERIGTAIVVITITIETFNFGPSWKTKNNIYYAMDFKLILGKLNRP